MYVYVFSILYYYAEHGIGRHGPDTVGGLPDSTMQKARLTINRRPSWRSKKVLEVQQDQNPRQHCCSNYVGKRTAESVMENRLEIPGQTCQRDQRTLCYYGIANWRQLTERQGMCNELTTVIMTTKVHNIDDDDDNAFDDDDDNNDDASTPVNDDDNYDDAEDNNYDFFQK
jgi:hypothetical protein